MTTALTVHPVNGEPRIRDLDLAERLGFDRPAKIRELIKRNAEKLKKFSVLPAVGKTSGESGGRPTEEYYLDQKQAIWLCMKSETDNAFEVQQEIVRVFDGWLNGTLESCAELPPTIPDALLAQAQAIVEQHRRLDAHDSQLADQSHKITVLQNQIGTLITALHKKRRRATGADPRQGTLSLSHRRKPHQGGHHASPQPHRRREHVRLLPSGQTVKVRAAVIGQSNWNEETLQ